MADPNPVVDAFKFVAVRPAKLPDAGTRSKGFIRDDRRDSEEGLRALGELGRQLADAGEAVRHWDRLDHHRLQALFDAHGVVRARYEAAAANGTELAASSAVAGTALASLNEAQAQALRELSWNALYAAHSTGRDAGPRLEKPLAALRALNFFQVSRDPGLKPRDALHALGARPVIPKVIGEAARPAPAPPAPPAPPPAETRPPAAVDEQKIREMLREFDAAHRLIEATSTGAAASRPVLRRNVTTSPEGQALSRQELLIGNSRNVQSLLTSRLQPDDDRLLTRLGITGEMSIPAAVERLQRHASSIAERANTMRGNPTLMRVLKDASIDWGLSPLIPPFDLGDFTPAGPQTADDVDMTGRIRPLGIGDLKVVKQTLLAYQPGEVAHVENVLKGEYKQRVHRALDRSETIVFTSDEETRETERDTQTTDRFELKKEAEETIKEDMKIEAGVTVTGGFGPVTITAHGDFAYSTSKEESQRTSANFARDVVDRSVSKIQKRVKSERTEKTFREVEETNTHGVDNKEGTGHITGVYRWVDKKYRAQIYNYGRRLMFEFIVPEPAAYYRASQVKSIAQIVGLKPPEPFVHATTKLPLSASDITETSYKILASRYNAQGITPPPPRWTYITTSFEQSGLINAQTASKSVKDLVVPEGYILDSFNAQVALIWENHPQFILQIGEWAYHLQSNNTARKGASTFVGAAPDDTSQWDNPQGVVPVSCISYDVHAFSVNVAASCECTQEHREKWQLQTYDKIYTAYKAAQTEYDQKIAQAGAQAGAVIISGNNPQTNRQIEKRELKKLCLTMLTGMHFNHFGGMTDPPDPPTQLPEIDVYRALDEGRFIQFFEQAFDWEQMTYLFFPYFWARKANWLELSNISDNDPLFAHFKSAGAARVVLPVTPAYNEAMLYFVESKATDINKKLWMGGDRPTLEDDLFESIADEMREQTDDLAGAVAEGEPWEFTIPTQLVWLQGDPALPVFT